jgi:hypothetical protein
MLRVFNLSILVLAFRWERCNIIECDSETDSQYGTGCTLRRKGKDLKGRNWKETIGGRMRIKKIGSV